MAYKITIMPLVLLDVEDAFKWYNKKSEGLVIVIIINSG